MNIEPWMIYVWGQADKVGIALEVSAFFLAAIGVIVLLIANAEGTECGMKWGLRSLIMGMVLMPLAILTPSSKTIAMMVIIPAISKSEVIQKDAPELYKMAIDALKERLEK